MIKSTNLPPPQELSRETIEKANGTKLAVMTSETSSTQQQISQDNVDSGYISEETDNTLIGEPSESGEKINNDEAVDNIFSRQVSINSTHEVRESQAAM